MNRSLRVVYALLVWALASCAPVAPAAPAATEPPLVLVTLDPNSTATPTPFQPSRVTDTPNPTETPLPTATASPTETPTRLPPSPTAAVTVPASTTPAATQAAPASTRTQYTFYVALDYAKDAVAAQESIRYTNTTGDNLSSVVLAVEPNLWTDCFSLVSLRQDENQAANYTLDGQRLMINLAQALAPGAVTTFSLGYSLSLPAKKYEGTFGYATHQINLTDWYPFIVPYAGGWLLHDPSSFGEHLVYDAADYDVDVQVNDPQVVLAASAPAEAISATTTHYHLEAARTFSLSASDQFKVSESAVGNIKILAYSFPGHEAANQGVVWMATQSLSLYQAKYAPYPHQSLSIVETDMSDGQEYDGLVFLATRFYSSYSGSAKSNLFDIGTHEIAHQWWFGLVGSDQAMEPWLDEALAVYSERIFYQYNYPNYGDWWWNFRVNAFSPHGYVDASVYDFTTFRDYVNAVYLNGAELLDDLRSRVGDDAFFAFLQDYASRFAQGRAGSHDFFAVLRMHTQKDFSDVLKTYFQNTY